MGNRMRRHLYGTIGIPVLCTVLGLLVACATPAPPTPTPEPVTIRFAFDAGQADYYDDLIEHFNEAHPEIQVERRTVRSAATWTYLFEQGEIDVFTVGADGPTLSGMIEEETILDLGPQLQVDSTVDLDDMYPSALEPFTAEGTVWGIPAGVNLVVLYYNAELFDQYGAAYPEATWTWDDLLSAAAQVRDVEEGIYGLVAPLYTVVPFIYQHGGRIVDDWWKPTRATFDDPQTVDAVEWFADLAVTYDVMPSPATAEALYGQNGEPAYIFWRQKAGMYAGWLSDQGGEAWGPGARWEMEWGMVPLPYEERTATLGLVYAYAIAAGTDQPEACWTWVTYLSEQIPPYTLPARRSIAESEAYREQVGPMRADVALASIDGALILGNSFTEIGTELEQFMPALVGVLNGNLLAREAMSDLQIQANAQ
ncbi:MAG: extracellular solute-binding protein [Anaerolineae bacterium]|nr:extracellular solute-binding protein [Anaerolineae bacterium]